MGFPDSQGVGGMVPRVFSHTPPSRSSPASEENLVASPGTTTDGGTISSMLGDSSAASGASSHRTTPVISRSNSGVTKSRCSNKNGRQADTIELADVIMMHRGGRMSNSEITSRTGSLDADTLSQTLDAAGSRIVTMTGTIKRGKKSEETVQVQLKLSENEINKLTESFTGYDEGPKNYCGLSQGPHLLLFTLLFMPLAMVMSLCMSFYLGTQAWYNLYLYLSEERTIWHRILLCPWLILLFPFTIMLLSVSLGLWGAVVQVSWYWASWLREMRDPEKGFYGWLFGKLQVPQCAPYQIVILDETMLNPQPVAQTTDV